MVERGHQKILDFSPVSAVVIDPRFFSHFHLDWTVTIDDSDQMCKGRKVSSSRCCCHCGQKRKLTPKWSKPRLLWIRLGLVVRTKRTAIYKILKLNQFVIFSQQMNDLWKTNMWIGQKDIELKTNIHEALNDLNWPKEALKRDKICEMRLEI